MSQRISALVLCLLLVPLVALADLTHVRSGWYPGWLADDFPPSSIPWSKYNAMTFAFATTTADVSTIAFDNVTAQALKPFVSDAHSNNVSALLSVGGYDGSKYFSPAVATADNRTAFAKTILNLVTQYDLDGIDFDWEYPGKIGLPCNVVNPDDSANFLLFLNELRTQPNGTKLILTAAVGIQPFVGSDGKPMTNVSAFSAVLDRIAIMNYDVWGSWSPTVGPNAPLNDTCALSANQDGSAVSAVNSWTNAYFPFDKILLGVPSYGHSFNVKPEAAINSTGSVALHPIFNASDPPLGPADMAPGADTAPDPCGNPFGVSSVFTFAELISSGFLDSDGSAASEISYVFDPCSQTTSQVMISYDDATSFAAKGKFINAQGLLGFAVWDVTGDQGDILLDSIVTAMGLDSGIGS